MPIVVAVTRAAGKRRQNCRHVSIRWCADELGRCGYNWDGMLAYLIEFRGIYIIVGCIQIMLLYPSKSWALIWVCTGPG